MSRIFFISLLLEILSERDEALQIKMQNLLSSGPRMHDERD